VYTFPELVNKLKLICGFDRLDEFLCQQSETLLEEIKVSDETWTQASPDMLIFAFLLNHTGLLNIFVSVN